MPRRLTAEEKAARAARAPGRPGRKPKEMRIRVQAVVLDGGQRQTLMTIVTHASSSAVMRVLQALQRTAAGEHGLARLADVIE